MKRTLMLLAVMVVVLLSGCQLWWEVFDPSYVDLIGTWDVDLGTRPLGWPDTQYVFNSGKTMEIYYGTLFAYKGRITGLELPTVTVHHLYHDDSFAGSFGALDMKMCCDLGSSLTTMRLGWYDDTDTPVYYLNLIKE
jgi:hypothetical protein